MKTILKYLTQEGPAFQINCSLKKKLQKASTCTFHPPLLTHQPPQLGNQPICFISVYIQYFFHQTSTRTSKKGKDATFGGDKIIDSKSCFNIKERLKSVVLWPRTVRFSDCVYQLLRFILHACTSLRIFGDNLKNETIFWNLIFTGYICLHFTLTMKRIEQLQKPKVNFYIGLNQ